MKNISTLTKVLIGVGVLVVFLVGLEIFQQSTSDDNYKTIEGTSELTTKTRSLQDFSKLIISSRMELDLKKGEPKIISELDDNLHDLVRFEEQSGTLRLFRKAVNYESENLFKVTVFANDLDHIELRNYSRLTSEEVFSADSIKIQLGSRSKATLAIEAEKAFIDIQDHSDLTIKGKIETLDAFIEGSSHLSGVECEVDQASIFMRSRSITNLDVKEKLSGKGTDRSKMYTIVPVDTSQYSLLDEALFNLNKSKNAKPWENEK